MIICKKCNIEKDNDCFRARKDSSIGYQYWCRECENIANKARYKPKPKRVSKALPDTKERKFKRMIKHRYNLTTEEYESMYLKQNKSCAICYKKLQLGSPKGLYIDHNHKTGKVRGLLCPSCNSAIGKLKEDIDIFKRAIDYLIIGNDLK